MERRRLVIAFITVAHYIYIDCSRHIFAAKSFIITIRERAEEKKRGKHLNDCKYLVLLQKSVFLQGNYLKTIVTSSSSETRARAYRQVFFSPFQSNRERSRFKQYRAATPKKKKKKKKKDVFWRLC